MISSLTHAHHGHLRALCRAVPTCHVLRRWWHGCRSIIVRRCDLWDRCLARGRARACQPWRLNARCQAAVAASVARWLRNRDAEAPFGGQIATGGVLLYKHARHGERRMKVGLELSI